MGILTPSKDAARVVNLGSSAAANTTLLQAALDASSYVYVRTGGEINDTLTIGDNTTLELGPGVTIKQADETDKNILKNSDTAGGNTGITIRGGTFDYSGQTPASAANLHAIVFENVTDLTIERVHGVDANKYMWLIADAENVTVRDLSFNTTSDGIHFQGPLTNADIRNIRGTTGDDMIAFTIGDYVDYELTRGDMKNIVVDGVYCDSAKSAIKMAGNTPYVFDGVTVRNVYGTCTAAVLNVVDGTDLTGTIADRVEFVNIQASTSSAIGVLLISAPDVGSLVLNGLTTDSTSVPIIQVSSGGSVDALTLANVSARNALAGDVVKVTGTVTSLVINNADVVLGASTGRLVNVDGTVTRAVVANASVANGTDVFRASSTATLGTLDMTNVHASGMYAVARILGSTLTVLAGNVTATGVTNFLYASGSGVTIDAQVGENDLGGASVFGTSGGTIRVNGIKFKIDVGRLTPDTGDVVHNTSGSNGDGTGPNIYDGSAWHNLIPSGA